MFNKHAVGVVLLSLLSGCSMWTSVRDYSVGYGNAIEQFANQDILTNILRARDNAPLHFVDLSQVTGSLQAAASVTTTAFFGQNLRVAKSADSAAPVLSFSSSPTFSVSPLDTQAFTVGMMQPLDPSFISNYWSSDSLPPELMFDLFVDSIENADQSTLVAVPASEAELINHPNLNSTAEFDAYVKKLLPYKPKLKTMTVMTPLGTSFPSAYGVAPLQLTPTELGSMADEISIHLGRASTANDLQLYRRWDNQLALCVNAKGGGTNISKQLGDTNSKRALLGALSLRGALSGGSKSASVGNGAPKSSTSSAATVIPSPVVSLIGMLDDVACRQEEYVVPDAPIDLGEEKIAQDSGKALQIHLRSTNEIVEYLGAKIRTTDQQNTAFKSSSDGTTIFFRLFNSQDEMVAAHVTPRVAVQYLDDKTYYAGIPEDGQKDYTLKVLALLSELINGKKLSSDISTTKQVQVIP